MTDEDVFSKLPQDVIFQILSKLPTKSLLQVRCVSKSFAPLICHPHFLRLHLCSKSTAVHPHQLLYYETTDYIKSYFSFHVDNSFSLCKILETPFKSLNGYLRLVGSSKGILCLFDTNYFSLVGTLILWNPFIGRFKILPFVPGLNSFKNNFSHMAVGFGFDHRASDFKVVKILYDCDSEHEVSSKAFVYEVKVGTWRSIEPVVPCSMPKNWSRSVFVNGVVHWLANKRPEYNNQPYCIMGFDVVKEIFMVIELPQNLGRNCREVRLAPSVDEKSLVLFVSSRDNLGELWNVWLMKDYGKVESWTVIHTVAQGQVFFPLKIAKAGEILAARNDEKLVMINVGSLEVEDLEVNGQPLTFCTAGYMPSLALLDVGEQLMK